MRRRLTAMALIAILPAAPAFAAGDAAKGQSDFTQCAGCHATTPGHNGIGPSLAGVVGRQAGSAPGYHYSTAMSNAHFTWNATTLDHFLASPQSVVHGTKMFASVPGAQSRQDVIAYLATLH